MIILPSRGRPEQLARFFERSRPELAGLLILDTDDEARYANVPLPQNWRMWVQQRDSLAEIFNRAFRFFPDEPFYAMAGDDLVCGPPGWDRALANSAGRHAIAYGDDGINGQRLCCFPFIGGDLVRAAGWIAPPSLGHLYIDSVWLEIGQRLQLLRYHPDITTEHYHWSTGKQQKDATARERRVAGDPAAFDHLMRTEIADIVERIYRALPGDDHGRS